jgi:hypothetical protein
MGYSMTVPFKSAEEKERMKTFLLANKEILDNLKNNKPYEPPHENTPYDGENLGYAPDKKNLLGFYGSGIPSYIWDVCAWMAVKSEVRDRNNLPYIYYDSEKEIITFDTSDKKNTLVDSEGIRIRQEPDISIPKKVIEMLMGTKKEQQNSTKLLNQLNNNWNEYINSLPPLTIKKQNKP